jgi:hypothetical protein
MRLALLLLFLVCAGVGAAHADFDRPVGIYLLSDPSPPASVTNVLSKPFVDGYAQRLQWTALEPAPGVYDFARIDSVVAAVQPLGKRFTLSILAAEVPHDLSAAAGAETVSVGVGASTRLTVLPWHAPARARWNSLLAALAEHPVPDAAAGGAWVPLRDHSLLHGLSGVPFGMNGIRDVGNHLRDHPLYRRDSLIAGVVRGQQALRDAFPGTFAWLAFFRMGDAIAAPACDVQLLDSLRARFWNGSGPPRLGLFEENFACSTPSTTFAFALAQEKENTYIAFQALQAWLSPFANPAATDSCLVMTAPGNRSSAVSGPEVGMERVYDAFHARYLELYESDLAHEAFADEFEAFWTQLHGSALGIDAPTLTATRLRLWPNPTAATSTIEFAPAAGGRTRLEILDLSGRRVATLVDAVLEAGTRRIVWDGRDATGRATRPGLYRVRCTSGAQRESRMLVRR